MKLRDTTIGLMFLLTSCTQHAGVSSLSDMKPISGKNKLEFLEKLNQPHSVQLDLDNDGLPELIKASLEIKYHNRIDASGNMENIPLYSANISIYSKGKNSKLGTLHLKNEMLPRISISEDQIIVEIIYSETDRRRYVSFINNGKYTELYEQMDYLR